MSVNKQRTLGAEGQHIVEYLKQKQAENSSFFYAFEGNNNNTSGGNVFWTDSNSRLNYSYFGDTVRLNTPYRANSYRIPFATFTGLNHHGQPVLFGCALLLNESDSSFIWLIQTWLQAMSRNFPVSITTEPDRLIQIAVAQVLPNTRHRFCKWSIFKETRNKLAHIYQTHPTFDVEFQSCVNESQTVDDFEACWGSLLQRYYLMDDEWLHSMFSARHQWVPVYIRDTFFGEMFTSEGKDMINTFFDGFVSETTTLKILIRQYEKAIASWNEKELKADFDTINGTLVLRTPSPMEKQAANIYTRRIFIKFQEELVETLANPATIIEECGTITTYRVAKFGEEHKAHTVTFELSEMKANCSCQMFEFLGIVCRHVLAVFRAKNVLTLPSHYVHKRWTRNAKSGAVLDECSLEMQVGSQDLLNARYNNLRQDAIKFVEEGSKSIHVYNVAMDALQVASKKIAAAKKRQNCEAAVALGNGDSSQTHVADENGTSSTYKSKVRARHIKPQEEKAKKICELSAELDSTNQRCEVYRSNLLSILRDMEDQKLKLSVKVQNARLSLKE